LDTAPLRHAGNTCPCRYEAENSNGRVDPQPPNYSGAWLSAIRAAVSINFINVAHDDVIIIPSTAAPLPSTLGQGFNITLDVSPLPGAAGKGIGVDLHRHYFSAPV